MGGEVVRALEGRVHREACLREWVAVVCVCKVGGGAERVGGKHGTAREPESERLRDEEMCRGGVEEAGRAVAG